MQITEKSVLNLLANVGSIFRKHNEIAKLTGEKFNVFDVLGLSTREVRTHSAFISELLNPKGSHGQGSLFLDLFLKQFNVSLDSSIANVEIEKYIGNIDLESGKGGYIDIIISNYMQAIIIENKIYAGDQNKQLLRYFNYGESHYGRNFLLFYLTLDGKDAEEISRVNLKEGSDYKLCSYKTDIVDWLVNCKKESSDLPVLRETISQYIGLIKKLTNQSNNDKMKNEIINSIINSGNIEEAIEIGNNIYSLKKEILQRLLKQIKDSTNANNFTIKIHDGKNGSNEEYFGRKDSAILFERSGLKFDVQIYFNNDFESTEIGISDKQDKWVGEYHKVFKKWEEISWTSISNGDGYKLILLSVEEYFNIIKNL